MKRKPDISRLIEFQELLLRFGAIERTIDIPPHFQRQENDIEHSYALAMSAWLLSSHFPELDRDKLIRYALAHDLVEIYAGDTYIYADQEYVSSKPDREAEALKRLSAEWPDFAELWDTIHDYETKGSREAKFIYALDKIQPIMLLYIGKGYGWRKHNVTLPQLHENKKVKVTASPEINEYYERLYELLVENAHYFPESSQPA